MKRSQIQELGKFYEEVTVQKNDALALFSNPAWQEMTRLILVRLDEFYSLLISGDRTDSQMNTIKGIIKGLEAVLEFQEGIARSVAWDAATGKEPGPNAKKAQTEFLNKLIATIGENHV